MSTEYSVFAAAAQAVKNIIIIAVLAFVGGGLLSAFLAASLGFFDK